MAEALLVISFLLGVTQALIYIVFSVYEDTRSLLLVLLISMVLSSVIYAFGYMLFFVSVQFYWKYIYDA